MGDDLERMIAAFRAQLDQRPNAAYNLVGLAELLFMRRHPRRAAQIAREAMSIGRDDPATQMRARRLLSSLLPGYHVAMMNDGRRNAAWDAALRRAVTPGMLVFDIGGGGGMLSLMAARAGGTVVACEMNPAAADVARDIAAKNGLSDHISIVTSRSQDIQIGRDLPRRADLLICDIFGDELLDFSPLAAIADARRRLLVPNAPIVPMAVSIHAALADWDDYSRSGEMTTACGFDLGPFADFVPASLPIAVDTAGLVMRGDPVELFRFDLSASAPSAGRRTIGCRTTSAGAANTIVRWIRLELDRETTLEACPGPQPFFSGPTLTPLAHPLTLAAEDIVSIGAAYHGRTVSTWIA